MQSAECPTKSQLEQLVLGKLSDAEMLPLVVHSESCAACQSTLQSLDDTQDRLLAMLRRVPPVGDGRLDALLDRLVKLKEDAAPEQRHDWTDWVEQTFGPSEPGCLGRIGDYRLLRILGSGGMGLVFEARDEQLQRLVAIKVLKPDRQIGGTFRQRFLLEARAIASLHHNHVVPVFHVGEHRQVPYLVMPLLRGCSLDAWLKREHRPTLPDVLHLGVQIIDGIAAAHAHGLVHRDIKPSNIWLEEPEPFSGSTDLPAIGNATACRVKLLDFGLARDDANAADHLSESGMILGTPAFMSPEQASGEPVDQRSDLFSFGCVLYRLLTGELPFPGKTVSQQLAAVLTKTARPVEELTPSLPRALAALVMQLLEREPSRRPMSARAVLDVFHELQRTVDGHPAATAAGGRQNKSSPSRHRTAIGWGAAVVLTGVAAFLVRKDLFDDQSAPAREVSSAATALKGSSTPRSSGPASQHSAGLVQANTLSANATGPKPAGDKTPSDESHRLEVVVAGLRARNPEYQGQPGVTWRGDRIVALDLSEQRIADVSPLAELQHLETLVLEGRPARLQDLKSFVSLRIQSLKITGQSGVTDFSPLASLPLRELRSWGVPAGNLEPLSKLPLEALSLGGCPVAYNLGPLREAPLRELKINDSLLADLRPLKGMKLERLHCAANRISDLEPLRGMPLRILDCPRNPIASLEPVASLRDLKALIVAETRVTSLAPLAGLKIDWLILSQCPLEDLSPLLELPELNNLDCDIRSDRDRDVLRKLSRLRQLNGKPPAALLE